LNFEKIEERKGERETEGGERKEDEIFNLMQLTKLPLVVVYSCKNKL
jgi:hypothetical protein